MDDCHALKTTAEKSHKKVEPPNKMKEIIEATTQYVKAFMSAYDASHDWSHIERVLQMAHKIEAAERVLHPEKTYDSNLITLASLLHDVGDRKYLKPGQSGETMVSSWLISQGVDVEFAEKVQILCTNVSYTNETASMGSVLALVDVIPELGIVQDADRLDSIGAVGIARLFAYTGAKCNERGLSVEHFHDKLLRIKDRMKTATGKMIAEERTKRLQTFLHWWEEEATVEA